MGEEDCGLIARKCRIVFEIGLNFFGFCVFFFIFWVLEGKQRVGGSEEFPGNKRPFS